MTCFPKDISFRYTWRSYQKRILDGLEEHLKNGQLHLVAPPGSGKTVLGLEVMLRINRPTLILAPTLTIKQQWASRFTDMFLNSEQQPDWVSTSIKKPAFVTITTYQALHALFNEVDKHQQDQVLDTVETLQENGTEMNREALDQEGKNSDEQILPSEAEEVINKLKELSIHTIIFDEAHHLRVAWWQCAKDFCAMLNNPTKISLTATPPYDVNPQEWQRYIELCGPIDEEISVPELVKHGELCPHQDYISFTTPSKEEAAKLREFRSHASRLKSELIQNETFIELIVNHPWVTKREVYIEEILSAPGYYSSMVIFLRASGQPVWKEALKLLGLKENDTPELSDEWLEELLNGIMFKDKNIDTEIPELVQLQKQLRRTGMIERRRVYIRSTPTFDKMLVQSSSKLDNIGSILEFELSVLQDKLRMVILTDYIRKENMPAHEDDLKPLNRLGVVPIFEMIRRSIHESGEKTAELPIGILSGSLVVLPLSAAVLIKQIADERGILLSYKPLAHDAKYITLDIRDSNRSAIVAIVTEVFSRGGVQVLIGTAALLGEGWDAPSINSLIMASYVGSFMLSNQMRGRAIRTDQNNAEKTGAIWHLACIDTNTADGGEDYASLSRRFRSLVGLSVKNETIESGIERMDIVRGQDMTLHFVEAYNEETLHRAKQRNLLRERWNHAAALNKSMTEELKMPSEKVPKPFTYHHTVKAVMIFAMFLAVGACSDAVMRPQLLYSDAPAWFKLSIVAIISAVIAGPWFYKAIKMYLRHHSIERSFRETAFTLYVALYEMKQMNQLPNIDFIRSEEKEGIVVCWLDSGSTQEKTIFLNALQQLVDPIENPRYLLYRESRQWFVTRRDYYAVPDEIGRRKEQAERFAELWRKHVGPIELVYTRTSEGRKTLLTARTKALSSMFIKKSERISAWR